MKIIHEKSQSVLGCNIVPATSFIRRLRGYMFYKSPKQKFDGIYFPNAKTIHNCFVRFPIDAIFIDKNNHIVKILKGFKPWRFSLIYLSASHVIELPQNTVTDVIQVGDKLLFD